MSSQLAEKVAAFEAAVKADVASAEAEGAKLLQEIEAVFSLGQAQALSGRVQAAVASAAAPVEAEVAAVEADVAKVV